MSLKILALATTTLFALTIFAVGCSAQTEDQALQSLRQMTRDGKLPSEAFVAGIESRFAGKRTGALAKLLHAHIKFENKDYAGAAAILNSEEFKTKTKVADHALWLRGSALQLSGNHAEAMKAFEKLVTDHPDSTRAAEARLLWAESAIAAGRGSQVPTFLSEQIKDHDPAAMLLAARSYEAAGNQAESVSFLRRTYFYGAGSDAAKEALSKLTTLGQSLEPQNLEEIQTRAEKLFDAKEYAKAHDAYTELAAKYPQALTPQTRLRHVTVAANLRKLPEAQSAFNSLPLAAKEREEGYYRLAVGYAKARQFAEARRVLLEMKQKYPNSEWNAKAWVDAGMAARDAKNRMEEQSFLRMAVSTYPKAVEVAGAQFELAWIEHENKNFQQSSQMLTEHLARYADKDTTNRGKAGYWAARDSERAGKIAEACALYEGVIYRYSANWYGYIGQQRLDALKSQGKCGAANPLPAHSIVPQAVASLKSVTVAPETSTPKEIARVEKSEDLSTVGLFDWAIVELQEAKKTAENSPKINLALAQHYQLKGDNVNALLALAKSYPDYSQMFPEEMGREEWQIFYPLTNWSDIKKWSKARDLDHYNVAGLIRQESVFNPRARSGAAAYGLMQLLVPTARATARKYGSTASISAETLYQPSINIELGTAYMRDQLTKFGRLEYMAVAYNAGPGRVPKWRAALPIEIDEFVEEIPFRETRGYVQGVVRNSAQYRRLYDDSGNFKSNVGAKPLRGEVDSKTRDEMAAQFPEVIVDDRTRTK